MTSDDYKAALDATRKMMANLQIQNEKLIKTLRYYADTDWREVTLFDTGKKAREVLQV